MKWTTSVLAGLVLAGSLISGPVMWGAVQQSDASAAPATGTTTDAATMPLDQLLPMTVHEAWVASGRNEDKFFAMVAELANLSAHKRGVTLPDNKVAGERAGAKFKALARKDPGQLLYVVVDTMVRHVAEKQAAGAAASK